MGKGSGFGKTILFGEHFVVYGLPAIAAAVSSTTIATVRRSSEPGWTLTDNRPAVPGYKKKKLDEQKVSIENILRFANIDPNEQGIHIILGGKLVCASGIGASAASSVAIARALNDEFKLGWDDNKVNACAYEGELGYHGTPSGIDNTAATFGGIVWYQRDLSGGPPTIEMIEMKQPTEILIASTGITASTKEVVADVRHMKEEKTKWFDQITEDYKEIANTARTGFDDLDLQLIGLLMNQNHNLLIEIGVSCVELEELVGVSRQAGAWGAKLTGTGRGGNMVALTPGRELQNNVFGAIKQRGYSAWRYRIGV
ncbi:MAG: mevalonate kinase [Candidatus Thorarchaeota archaeon]